MKNFNLFDRRSATVQAGGCAKLFGLVFVMLLTLGVGEMKGANEYNRQFLYVNSTACSWWTNNSAQPALDAYWKTDYSEWAAWKELADGNITTGYWYFDLSDMNDSYLYFRGFRIQRHPKNTSDYWNAVSKAVEASNTKNCLVVASDGNSLSWGTYAPPMSTVTLTDNGTSIVSGSGTSGSPYLVYVGATIKVSASGTKAVADPAATINYNFKEGSTSKQNNTSSTYQFTASSTANTTYTINLDGYTKVSSTSSTTTAATALYYKTIDVPASSHSITYTTQSTGWTYGTQPSSASEDDAVTFVVNPTAGYTVSVTSSDVVLTGPNASNQYSFTMPDDDVAISVSATENKRSVSISVSPTGTGTLDKASATVGVSTTTSVTATPNANYAFVSWTATNCSVSSETDATITLSGDGSTGSGTLVANFAPQWNILGSGTEMGGWATYNQLAYVSSNTFRGTITLAANTVYEFKVVDRKANAWYGYDDAAGKLSFVGQTTASPALSTETENIYLMSAGAGTYTFEWNSSSKTLTVSYPSVTHPSSDYIYFKDDDTPAWTVAGHLWGGSSGKETSWGSNPALSSFTFNGGTYYYMATGDHTGAMFGQGIDDSHKTADLTVSGNQRKWYSRSNKTWNAFTVSITYKDQGGSAFSGTQTSPPTTHTYGTATTLKIPTKTGYDFGGWFTASDCASGAVGNTSSASLGATDYTADITLYAKWTAKKTTVTLNLNGGTAGSESVMATYDEELPDFTTATKTGSYNLTGYWTESSGGTKVINADGTFAANDGIWNRTDGPTLTLYAQWSNFLTVTYDGNGNTGGTAPTDATEYSSGATVTVKAKPDGLVKTGYTFAGWKASGVTYSAGQTFTITANTTLVAQWTENLTTVTINVNPTGAGTLTLDESEFTPGNTITAGVTTHHSVTTTANVGYAFNNWTITGNATGSATSNTYALEGNGSGSTGTLTANFTAKTLVQIYFSNPNNWGTVNAYVYADGGGEEDNSWPGVAAESAVINCNTFYYFEYYKEDHPYWNTIIFNNGSGGDGNQTANLSYDNATSERQYTNGLADDWYDSPAQKWVMKGSMSNDGWATAYDLTCESATSGYTEIDLAANTDYEFKFVENGSTWYGCTTATNITYDNKATAQTMSNTAGGSANQTITTAGAGTYRFTWDIENKKVTVTYPTSYTVTYSVGTVQGQSDEPSAAISGGGAAIESGKYVVSGTSVTFTAEDATTGYTWEGWYDAETTAGTKKSEGDALTYTTTITANTIVYAVYSPKTYTITLDKQTSATGYGASGSATNPTATYNAVLSAISGTMPTGTGAYGFMGFYTGENGTGSRLTDGSGVWIASVDGYTDADKKWIHDGDVTLYAYYKQAEVAKIDFEEAIVETSSTVTATPTIEPIPTSDYVVCWRVLYSNDNPLASQPTFTPGVGNSVSFTAPDRSGSYKLEATLRTGTSCGSGDVLHIKKETFQVASEHDVTVLYKCGDMTIKASETLEGIKPLEWSDEITAPTITGYTFHHWAAGDGVTLSKNGSDAHANDTAQVATIYIKATYDGTLTAVYTQKRMIYFYNTLNWGSVYVYFYKNDSYWQTGTPYKGSGTKTTWTWTDTPYSEGLHGQMRPVSEGSKIYCFDAEGAGVNASYDDVVFTEHLQHDYEYFYQTNAVRRGDYKSSMPMFVPLLNQTAEVHNQTNYYNSGYWMNYPENSGYTLKIYDSQGASTPTRTIRFPYSTDLMMPLKLEVDLNDPARDYYYTIYREDGTVLSANYDMNQNWHSNVQLNDDSKKIKITTTASGIYTFTLVYMDNEGTKDYYISVDYPIGANDYRVWYSDTIAWSGAKHTSGWYHASDIIRKNADAEVTKYDTVSFYVATGAKITSFMKFQYASAIAESGSVTWTDVADGGITISSYSSVITESGVYDFIIKQVGTAKPVVEKVEPYTGNYYIRTDCAGNTKWDSYKASDHMMTYSDYAEKNSGYSHYFAHWVTNGSNVKFCIANDYSSSITDTLTQDYGTAIANINEGGFLASGDEHNANIRFMWNHSTNKLSRAYIAGSGDISKRFLVLEGDEKMYDENGHSLTGEYQDHDKYGNYLGTDDQVVLHDDENFVYERTIQLNTKARAKLTAKYNSNVQYFIGSSSETVELLGGDPEDVNKYSMRIVYDFKTNRLVTAYIPNGDITTDLEIHADIMLVREHQEAGQQLIFKSGGSLSDVKTVYGVLRLNRWTLNNKEKTGSHSLVGDPKSVYERSFYWISFPFDVNLSDVFGFGTYGTHWAIEEYDGAARAKNGYWKDSEGFWNIIENRSNYVLRAGTGYVLAIDLDLMKDNNTDFWSNNIEQVELFFPSASEVENIEAIDTEITVPSHECTIDRRTDKTIPDTDNDRTTVDSHWNLIGVPSYANYGSTLKDGSGNAITWKDPSAEGLPYLYEWNSLDDSYTPQSVTTYPFKTMHSYMVQYTGKIKWSLASASPSVPARRVLAETKQEVEFRLEIQQNNKKIDQTFVRLSNDEQISTEFAFDEDMTKEFNKGKANVYTIISGYLPAAGNTLPMSEQTTVVPVGVKVVTNDDYTFSIPEGTEGVGVTLVDTETGIRTVLSAVDYTVSLEAGTYNNRFVLEISPIRNMPTEIEGVESQKSKVESRKLLIDGLLYIVRDGKVYDARGARVE